uniref:Uncharacterized protein n=1 Tax=Caenorhabditis tropicalis TaxID=1561998 RepID=A0A1I7U537_9PELO
MPFERKNDFKISLANTMQIMNRQDDLLKTHRQAYFHTEKFKTEFLMNQCPEKTELIYKLAKSATVFGTFEKLKREIMDIQLANRFKTSKRRNPVVSYEITSHCSRRPDIFKFAVQLDLNEKVNVILKMGEQPKSAVFPDHPRNKYIQICIGRKIPASEKLKEAFNQIMNNGGHMIEFITDSLLPSLFKLRPPKKFNEKASGNRLNGKKTKDIRNFPIVSLSLSGSERASKPSYPRIYSTDERSDRKSISTDRGVRIPRCNQALTNLGKPRYDSSSQRNRQMGGSFGARRDASMGSRNFETYHSGSGKYEYKRISTGGKGSENENWRNNCS